MTDTLESMAANLKRGTGQDECDDDARITDAEIRIESLEETVLMLLKWLGGDL